MLTIDAYRSLWNDLNKMWLDRTSHTIERDLARINQIAESMGLKKTEMDEAKDFKTVMGMKIPTQDLVVRMESKRSELQMAIMKKIEELEPMFG